MSPTYEAGRRFLREYAKLSEDKRRAFREARQKLVAGLRKDPPEFPGDLRVKRVQGTPGVWEITFAPDGRATFAYGPEVREGQAHLTWRRIGTHDVLGDP